MKLWHCYNARSLRPLWTLEEMGLDYDLELLPFPPRIYKKEFLGINPLGTVPYFEDQTTKMTESTAICHYLVEHYQKYEFGLEVNHPEYGDYLNWLYHADATLTFPQTIYLRYTHLEQENRRLPQAAEDYAKWFIARMRRLDAHIIDRKFLCDNRFTIADIAIGYALYLGESLGLSENYSSQVKVYLENLKKRNAFQKAINIGKDENQTPTFN